MGFLGPATLSLPVRIAPSEPFQCRSGFSGSFDAGSVGTMLFERFGFNAVVAFLGPSTRPGCRSRRGRGCFNAVVAFLGPSTMQSATGHVCEAWFQCRSGFSGSFDRMLTAASQTRGTGFNAVVAFLGPSTFLRDADLGHHGMFQCRSGFSGSFDRRVRPA